MGKYYQWADLVIGRAGAMTIAELEHVGLPSILIPYPYAIDDHQQKNAEYLLKKGGAMICKEQDITLKLEGILQKISKKKCIEMAKRLKSSKHKNAASLIFSQIENNGK
jgi:UDP-N-acetylglucosamine--N-acetylmuramyl-(pentapeptide) pyrophosphoryl-undecaprenol N-acetylglucosamine transferase